jgi:hypothetical protein
MPTPSLYSHPWCDPSSLLSLPAGSLRGYNMAAPSLAAPSLTPPQLGPPNLQQFFPQATRQSLLGPPPVGVPMNPSQLNLSGRNSQKQTRIPSSTTPNRKVSGAWGKQVAVRMGKGTAECELCPLRLLLGFGQVTLPPSASFVMWAWRVDLSSIPKTSNILVFPTWFLPCSNTSGNKI